MSKNYIWPVLGLLLSGGTFAQADDNSQSIIANGHAGQLTSDGFEAYYEALVFCLGQVGAPSSFSESDKQGLSQLLVNAFPSLPAETQQALAIARTTWTQYQNAWPTLNLDQKKAFAYDVLSLAYGEAAAAQALGLEQSAPGYESAGAYSATVPMTEDYWKTYSGGTPQGDGTYEFESYNGTTGSYDYTYE